MIPASSRCRPGYRFYDWDAWGRLLLRAYDYTLAPATQFLVKYVLRIGTVFYGGNFAVRREALEQIGGFDTAIEFHGEDTNVGRRLFGIGKVSLVHDCFLFTSARRYVAMGKGAVFRLYVRTSLPNCCTTGQRTRRMSMCGSEGARDARV